MEILMSNLASLTGFLAAKSAGARKIAKSPFEANFWASTLLTLLMAAYPSQRAGIKPPRRILFTYLNQNQSILYPSAKKGGH